MAARRERDRRRPSGERRYRFVSPEAELETDEALLEQDGRATEATESSSPPPRPRQARATSAQPAAPVAQIKPARTTRPFSAYKDEYAYVYEDLRRVGMVIGSLLVVLIVLYFVVPLLAR
jgi:hypothetical protein